MTVTFPAPITSGPVTRKGVLTKATAAGIAPEKLTVDSLGRYFVGSVFMESSSKHWTVYADGGQYRLPSLAQAFAVAKQLDDARDAMVAQLDAMTDDALQALILDPESEYMWVQYAMHTLYTKRGWKTLRTR